MVYVCDSCGRCTTLRWSSLRRVGVSELEQLTQRQRVTQYALERYGVEPEHLWKKYPSYAALRHPASKKWFALIMGIPRNRLELKGDEPVDVMDVKCGPLMVGSLLAQDGFCPAYYMSKSSWISIILDGTVPDEQIFSLMELSYDSVAPKRKGGALFSAGHEGS